MQGLHTKELLYLGSITNDVTFTFEEDGVERPLLDFVMQQPEVIVRNGCGRYEERMSPRKAVEKVNRSSYGATVTLTYDDAWMEGDIDGYSKIRMIIPTECDMF